MAAKWFNYLDTNSAIFLKLFSKEISLLKNNLQIFYTNILNFFLSQTLMVNGNLVPTLFFHRPQWNKISFQVAFEFLCLFDAYSMFPIVASWGLPGRFLGLSGDLVNKIRKPKKLAGSPKEALKTFRAEILTIFLLVYWSKRWHQKDISKLTNL